MKKIGIALFSSYLLVGCTLFQQEKPVKEAIESVKSPNHAPAFFHLSVLKDVNWQESPSFVEGKVPLKGIQGKIAMADSPFIANKPTEQMWFFFDSTMPSGNLSMIALKQGFTTPTPVLFQNETSKQTWTVSHTIDSNTKELPLLMSLPSPGLWVLNIYIDENFYEQIVINVEQNGEA